MFTKLKYENVVIILYVGFSITKYLVTNNLKLLTLIYLLYLDVCICIASYLVIKHFRKKLLK